MVEPYTVPPRVTKFHHRFDGWLGDPILETVVTFIVTNSLKRKIELLRATGVQFGPVELSKSDQFEEVHPGLNLPEFDWLQVTGTAGKDDFGLSAAPRLVVSQRVLDLLRSEGIAHCDITAYD